MSNVEIALTHEQLKEQVIRNANLFYNGKQTEINDMIYDAYLELIKKYEPTFDIYDYIEYETDGLSILHTATFRDFNKSADIDEYDGEGFAKLLEDYIITPKFDGSSTVTYYKHGKLDKILSRGDDEYGFLNTKKLRGKVEHYREGVSYVLGEAVVPVDQGGRAKANGLINSKYSQLEVDELLTVIPFDMRMEDGTWTCNPEVSLTDISLIERIRDSSLYTYRGKDYPCDGIVCYPKDGNPVIKIIKVYFTEKKESTIRDISWGVSWNSGIYHPVALFDTVELDGTAVSRASLYNYQNVLDNKIGIGSVVEVIKANMTIPQILSNTPVEVQPTQICPYCGSPLVQYNLDLVCSNKACLVWTYLIRSRLVNILSDDYTKDDFIYSNSYDYQIILDLIPSDWYSKLCEIGNLMWVISIPRVGESKIDRIESANNGVVYTSIDDSLKFIEEYLSDLQYEYLELIRPTLEYVIDKLKELQ